MNDDIILIETTLPNIKLEFDIAKKKFCGGWQDNHYHTPSEFTREIYLEIAKKYEHVDGMKELIK